MTRWPRSVRGVYAMARPRRPPAEAVLVCAAANDLGLTGSARERGWEVARAVAELAVADVVQREAEELMDAAAALAGPAVIALATDPQIDVAKLVRAEFIRAIEATGFTALPDHGAVAMTISGVLAERYRRHLKNISWVG